MRNKDLIHIRSNVIKISRLSKCYTTNPRSWKIEVQIRVINVHLQSQL